MNVLFSRRAHAMNAHVCQAFHGDNRGVAMVEFAFALPFLILLAVATYDLGAGIHRHMQVQDATQMGAAYTMAHGFNATAIASAVQNATGSTLVTASPAPTEYCGCPGASGITVTDCSSTCSDGTTPGTYVQVSGTSTYTPVISYPFMPTSFTLTAQSTVRIQ